MAHRSPPAFLRQRFDTDALSRDLSTLVAIDERGTMLWMNPAWDRFARENGGRSVLERFDVGASYFDGIAHPLRRFYEEALSDAFRSGKVFERDYECSSPDAFRLMRLRALPIGGQGLLVQHRLAVVPHEGTAAEALEASYRGADGMILQCSNCRCVRRADGGAWDWVQGWATHGPGSTSHGLCDVCLGFYHGGRR